MFVCVRRETAWYEPGRSSCCRQVVAPDAKNAGRNVQDSSQPASLSGDERRAVIDVIEAEQETAAHGLYMVCPKRARSRNNRRPPSTSTVHCRWPLLPTRQQHHLSTVRKNSEPARCCCYVAVAAPGPGPGAGVAAGRQRWCASAISLDPVRTILRLSQLRLARSD